MKTISLAFFIFFCLTIVSCKKDAAKQNATISYQLKAKNTSTTVARNLGTLTWTSGYAYVTEIKFEAEGECQIEGQSDIKKTFSAANPLKVDLFAPLLSLGNIPVPPCDYRNSKIEMALTPGAGNAALELTGTFNTTPIIFRINSAIELQGIGGNTGIASGTSYTALTSLNLSLLTRDITALELNAATRDGSGRIIISSTSNVTLYQKMLNNFQDIEEEEFH